MKGIILAGGTGSRLYPLTVSCNKQLLPVYDKPMIYYPLSTLIKLGIRDIRIVSSPDYITRYVMLFADGDHLGLNLSYKVQTSPRGLPEAFLLSEDFIKKGDETVLILGDNIFHGDIPMVVAYPQIFAYKVRNPSDYGVVEFDERGKVVSLEEKPKVPKSKYAVPGLYKMDDNVVDFAKTLVPSKRNELEITDLLNIYIKENGLITSVLGEGFVWLDAGSPSMLYQAAAYVQTVQERTGKKIGCIHEDVFKQGFINRDGLIELVTNMPKGEYRQYLEELL